MELKGKIIEVTEPQTGTTDKGDWAKRTIVVSDELAQHPNKFVLNLFKNGEHIEYATTKFSHSVGDMVEITYSVRANEYNGKWYGDNSIFKINKVESTPENAGIENIPDSEDDLPF